MANTHKGDCVFLSRFLSISSYRHLKFSFGAHLKAPRFLICFIYERQYSLNSALDMQYTTTLTHALRVRSMWFVRRIYSLFLFNSLKICLAKKQLLQTKKTITKASSVTNSFFSRSMIDFSISFPIWLFGDSIPCFFFEGSLLFSVIVVEISVDLTV